jgi:hypothetical protein
VGIHRQQRLTSPLRVHDSPGIPASPAAATSANSTTATTATTTDTKSCPGPSSSRRQVGMSRWGDVLVASLKRHRPNTTTFRHRQCHCRDMRRDVQRAAGLRGGELAWRGSQWRDGQPLPPPGRQGAAAWRLRAVAQEHQWLHRVHPRCQLARRSRSAQTWSAEGCIPRLTKTNLCTIRIAQRSPNDGPMSWFPRAKHNHLFSFIYSHVVRPKTLGTLVVVHKAAAHPPMAKYLFLHRILVRISRVDIQRQMFCSLFLRVCSFFYHGTQPILLDYAP